MTSPPVPLQAQPGSRLDVWMNRLFLGPWTLGIIWLVILLADISKRKSLGWAFSGQVIDNESFLHLVRHLSGGWWGTGGWTQAINAPVGTVIHWTYPYDLFLALVRAPLGLLMDDPRLSLGIAGAWSSAIPTLVAMLVLYRVGCVWRDRAAGMALALLYLVAPPILSYSNIGRADHHSLTLMMSVLFLAAIFF